MNHRTKYRFEQMTSGSASVHKLYVYDDVRADGKFNWNTWEYEESETSAKYFRDQLDAIPNGSIIELHVNSAGGEVAEGVAIYNLLRQKAEAGCKLIGYVDGTAYSIAMNIIMACDEIHMGLGTSMFLHNPWTYAQGNAETLRNTADQLDELTNASVQLYMSRAKNLSEEDLREMMKKETMMAPDKCLAYGFCDIVGEQKGDPEDPKKTDEPMDDKEKIKELQEQLFRQMQINQMMKSLPKTSMKSTFSAAVKQFMNK